MFTDNLQTSLKELQKDKEKTRNKAVATALASWWEKLVSQFTIWITVQPGSTMAEGTP